MDQQGTHGDTWHTVVGLIGSFMGYALCSVWFSRSGDYMAPVYHGVTMECADAATLLAVALLYRRIGSLRTRPAVRAVVLTCIGIVGCGLVATGVLGSVPLPVLVACNIAQGVGGALITLAWLEAFCELNLRNACIAFGGVSILGQLARSLLDIIGGAPAMALSMACGVAGTLLLARERHTDHSAADETPSLPVGPWTIPLKPVILMGVYAFATALAIPVTHALPESGLALSAWYVGKVAVYLYILVVALVCFRHMSMRLLYTVAIVCTGAALLGAAGCAGWLEEIARILSSLGFSCFSALTYIVFFDMAFRSGANPLWLFGLSRGVRVVATLAADAIGVMPGSAQLLVGAGSSVFVVLALVLVGLSTAFATHEGFASLWEVTYKEKGTDHGSPSILTLADRCARIATLKGLTRREEEVLALLATGCTVRQVEERLVVSYATARSHVQHVYAKLGVHSREEAAELVRTFSG